MNPAAVLAVCAVLAQIAYPLTRGDARDAVTATVVLLGAAACVTDAARQRGAVFAAGLLAVTAGGGLLAEVVGTSTGVPFGCYDYAQDRLGPALAGVPLIVPLAWTAGLYPVCVVAGVVCRRTALRVLGTAVGMVGWDFYLDPQMVHDRQWTWCSTSGASEATGNVSGASEATGNVSGASEATGNVSTPALPGLGGIPWTNYLGWFLVAAVMAAVLVWLQRRGRTAASQAVPIGLFLWTWLGSALAHAVLLGPDLRWSALYGLVGMGVLGVPLLFGLIRSQAPSLAR